MNKRSASLLIILLLIFPIISAVEFDMKTEFKQGETFMARVSGNFLEPILKENIFFYRGHVRVPMEYDVAKIDEEFYIYAQLLGKAPNNYSIVIKNTKYMAGAKVSEEDTTKNFSINNETADFSIEPGFIITQGPFSIEVQNLQDFEITIKVKTSDEDEGKGGFFGFLFDNGEEDSVTFKSGEIKNIDFEFENITETSFKKIELSTDDLKYKVPVYIIAEGEEEQKPDFRFDSSGKNISMSTDSNATRTIYLRNTGDSTIENISLTISDSLKPYVNLSSYEIKELKEDEEARIEIYIFSDEEEKSVQGQITAKANETLYAYFFLFLNFIPGYIPVSNGDDEDLNITKTCAELKGTICDDDEECSQETILAKDAVCCPGTCEKIEESSTGKIIGWVIVVFVVIFLLWFFMKKFRRTKRKEVDLFKIAKGKR